MLPRPMIGLLGIVPIVIGISQIFMLEMDADNDFVYAHPGSQSSQALAARSTLEAGSAIASAVSQTVLSK